MRLDFLGDTYDLAKSFLMRCLAPDGPWGIVPMFTDDWDADEIAVFEKLLDGEVLNSRCIKGTQNRAREISARDWIGHVFFDPDTGVQFPDSNTGSTTRIRLNELVREAGERPEHLILVFDQSYANAKLPLKTRAMRKKLLLLEDRGLGGFGYVGQASFLILSRNQAVLRQARQNLLDAGVPDSRLIP